MIKNVGGKLVDTDIEYITVPKFVKDISEYLAKLVHFVSPNGVIERDEDWKIIVKLFEAWTRCYPNEFQTFAQSVEDFRSRNTDTKGYTKDKEMKHFLEIPERFYQMIKAFYPLQEFDRDFARRLARELPIMRVEGNPSHII